MTVGLLAVVVYLYTVVAFNFFRKFYNKSEDEDEPDMKCDDMMTVSWEGGGDGFGWSATAGFPLVLIVPFTAVLPLPHVRGRTCRRRHR